MVKAVVFDLDDTLISEFEYVKSGYRHIASLLAPKLNVAKERIYKDMINIFRKSQKNVFNQLLDSYQVTYEDGYIVNLVNEYRSHYPNITFHRDVDKCMKKLKELGIKTGIITDGYAVSQRNKLKSIHASQYFDEIIITDELGRDYWKPDARSFQMMKERLLVEYDEMIYVGDNPEKDFYIRKHFPITTVRIYRDGIYQDKSYLENVKEMYLIHNLEELVDIIS